jgi:hypothetical protein
MANDLMPGIEKDISEIAAEHARKGQAAQPGSALGAGLAQPPVQPSAPMAPPPDPAQQIVEHNNNMPDADRAASLAHHAALMVHLSKAADLQNEAMKNRPVNEGDTATTKWLGKAALLGSLLGSALDPTHRFGPEALGGLASAVGQRRAQRAQMIAAQQNAQRMAQATGAKNELGIAGELGKEQEGERRLEGTRVQSEQRSRDAEASRDQAKEIAGLKEQGLNDRSEKQIKQRTDSDKAKLDAAQQHQKEADFVKQYSDDDKEATHAAGLASSAKGFIEKKIHATNAVAHLRQMQQRLKEQGIPKSDPRYGAIEKRLKDVDDIRTHMTEAEKTQKAQAGILKKRFDEINELMKIRRAGHEIQKSRLAMQAASLNAHLKKLQIDTQNDILRGKHLREELPLRSMQLRAIKEAAAPLEKDRQRILGQIAKMKGRTTFDPKGQPYQDAQKELESINKQLAPAHKMNAAISEYLKKMAPFDAADSPDSPDEDLGGD